MTTKTTIQGAPRRFDEKELKQWQEDYRNAYQKTTQCMEVVRGDIAYSFFCSMLEKAAEGYVLAPNLPITTEPTNYFARMIKPQHIQEQDMLALDQEVKGNYVAELEAEHAHYRELLKQQLLEADAEKERKKAAAAVAKRLAEIDKEVLDCFSPLEIPE